MRIPIRGAWGTVGRSRAGSDSLPTPAASVRTKCTFLTFSDLTPASRELLWLPVVIPGFMAFRRPCFRCHAHSRPCRTTLPYPGCCFAFFCIRLWQQPTWKAKKKVLLFAFLKGLGQFQLFVPGDGLPRVKEGSAHLTASTRRLSRCIQTSIATRVRHFRAGHGMHANISKHQPFQRPHWGQACLRS